MEIDVGVAKREDLEDIKRISRNSVDNDYILYFPERWFGDGVVLIARSGNDAVGFQKCEITYDGSMWMSGIRVEREWRRKGVATALISRAIALARSEQIRLIRLMIYAYNSLSIALVEKNGFRLESQFIELPLNGSWRLEDSEAEELGGDVLEGSPFLGNGMICHEWRYFSPSMNFVEYVNRNSIYRTENKRSYIYWIYGRENIATYPVNGKLSAWLEKIDENSAGKSSEEGRHIMIMPLQLIKALKPESPIAETNFEIGNVYSKKL